MDSPIPGQAAEQPRINPEVTPMAAASVRPATPEVAVPTPIVPDLQVAPDAPPSMPSSEPGNVKPIELVPAAVVSPEALIEESMHGGASNADHAHKVEVAFEEAISANGQLEE